jgi:hypothetical protein
MSDRKIALETEEELIWRFTHNATDDDLQDRHRAAIITLLRSDIELSRHTRDLLSNELSSLWWPNPMREKRAHRQFHAEVARHSREALIDRMQGKPKAEVKEALRKLAKRWGHASDRALLKACEPNRLRRGTKTT